MPFPGGAAVKKHPAVSNCTRFKIGDIPNKTTREQELRKAAGVVGYVRSGHGIPEAVVAAPTRANRRRGERAEPEIFPSRIEARLNKVLDAHVSHVGKVFRRGEVSDLRGAPPWEDGGVRHQEKRKPAVRVKNYEDPRERRQPSPKPNLHPRMRSPVSAYGTFLNFPEEVANEDIGWDKDNANEHSIFSPVSVFSVAPKKSTRLARPKPVPDTDLTQIPSVKQSIRRATQHKFKVPEPVSPALNPALGAMQALCQRLTRPGEFREEMRNNLLEFVKEAREMMPDQQPEVGSSSDDEVANVQFARKPDDLKKKGSYGSLNRIFPSPCSVGMVAVPRRFQEVREQNFESVRSREKVEEYLRGCPGEKMTNVSHGNVIGESHPIQRACRRQNVWPEDGGHFGNDLIQHRKEEEIRECLRDPRQARRKDAARVRGRDVREQQPQVPHLQGAAGRTRPDEPLRRPVLFEYASHQYVDPSREKPSYIPVATRSSPPRQKDAARIGGWKRSMAVLTPPLSQGSPLMKPSKRFSRDEPPRAPEQRRELAEFVQQGYRCKEAGDGLPEFGDDFARAFSRRHSPNRMYGHDFSTSHQVEDFDERHGVVGPSHGRNGNVQQAYGRHHRRQSPSPPRRMRGRLGAPTPAVSIAALTEYPIPDDFDDLGKTPNLSYTLEELHAAMEENRREDERRLRGGVKEFNGRAEYRSRRDQFEMQHRKANETRRY